MDKRIQVLFLIESSISFVSRALKGFLEEKEILTDVLEIKKSISEHPKEMPPIVVVDANVLMEHSKERVFLYDFSIEHGAKFVIMGEQEEIDEVSAITAPSLIAKTLIRPINAKEAADAIDELLEKIKNNEIRKSIMVVDDSPTFLRTVLEWLENDYNVQICPSALAAIKLISEKKPDLILLDYEMPVCTGAQFLEMLNSDATDVRPPVIFLTSRNDQETVRELLALKPEGYLLKTQPKESILNSIQMFFNKLASES